MCMHRRDTNKRGTNKMQLVQTQQSPPLKGPSRIKVLLFVYFFQKRRFMSIPIEELKKISCRMIFALDIYFNMIPIEITYHGSTNIHTFL
jgi:hypothetical protein